jgi:hypothetical protein
MSDYLTNLAARALRPQNMVRPKLPSRYERATPGPPTTNPEDPFFRNSPSLIELESESFDASPSSQAPSVSDVSVDARLDRPGNLKLATPALGDMRSAQTAQSRSSDNRVRFGRSQADSTREESETFAQPDAPAPEQQRVEREHQDFHQWNAPPKVLDTVEAVCERVVRSKRLTSSPMESVFQLEGFTSTDEAPAETETPGESTSTSDQKSTQEGTSIKVRPEIIASKIVESRYSPAGEFDPQPGSKAETTVNVSIGRVEVRAVQAPASQPRSARDSVGSAMTLDEYLEKRRGGGQR